MTANNTANIFLVLLIFIFPLFRQQIFAYYYIFIQIHHINLQYITIYAPKQYSCP